MTKISLLFSLLLIGALVSSMSNCDAWKQTIQASDNITTEIRRVDEFDKIRVEGAFSVDVTYSSNEEVSVEAPDNLQSYVVLKVKSGTLVIELKKTNSYNTQHPVKVHISTAKLHGFEISGASSVRLNNTLSDKTFTMNSSGAASFSGNVEVIHAIIESNGASNIKLTGSAETASFELNGAMQLLAYQFNVSDVDINMLGACKAQIKSTNTLKGAISGACSLKYKGDPKENTITTSGVSKASKA